MTDNIDVVVKEQGTNQVVQSFDSLTASAKRAHTEVSALQKLLGNVARSTAAANKVTALGTAAQGAAGHVGNLNSALGALNNTRVTSQLNSTNSALSGTASQASNAANSVRNLVGAFLSFQAIKNVIGSLIEAQITMQQIHYGLLSATGSAQGAAEQFEFLRETSERLGTNLRSSGQEYTRLAASAEAMNVKVEDQQKLYTGLSKAATVFHLDAQKMQFATLALTQMFSKGKIQAEELRRQLGEAIPGVVPRFQKAVMESIKGTDLQGKSFDELMKKGLLVTDKFLPQLIQALEETGSGWEEASKGLNAEINRMKNAWFELKVELTEGLFTQATLAIVRFLTANMKELTGAVIALGVAIGIALAPTAITAFIGYVKVLGAAVWAAAGPFGILAGAIVGVVTYLTFMRDEIKIGVDQVTTFGDVLSVLGDDFKGFYDDVKYIPGFIAEEFKKSAALWLGYNADSLDDMEFDWLALPRSVFLAFDLIARTIRGTMGGVYEVVSGVIKAMMNNFTQLGNAINAAKEFDAGGIMDAVKANIEGWKAGADIAGNFSKGWETGLERYGFATTEWFDSVIERAKKKAMFRNVQGGSDTVGPTAPTLDPTGGGDKKGNDKAAKELERLKDALSRVLGQIDPTQEALRKLAEAQEILDKSVAKHLITQEKADWVMGRLRDKYKEQLDPIGFLIDKYKEEREVLQYVGDEQRIQAELLTKVRDLKKKNYEVTDEQVAALRREIEATQEATRVNQAYNAVLNETVYAQRSQLENLKAIADMKALGEATGGKEGISGGQAAQQVVGVFGEDNMAGTAEYYAAQLQTYTDFMAQVQAARDQNLIGEQTANMLSLQAWNTLQEAKLQGVQTFLGSMSSLMSSNNKTAFKIGQAAAIAETSINTYKAATGAYAAMAGIPYIGPILGVAAAAAAVAAGIANISKIRSQQPPAFRTGGSMVVGGSGGIDSQLVQFNATPGENININTPSEARATQELLEELRQNGGRRGRGDFHQNLTIIQQGKPNRKTTDQEARKVRRATKKEYEANA